MRNGVQARAMVLAQHALHACWPGRCRNTATAQKCERVSPTLFPKLTWDPKRTTLAQMENTFDDKVRFLEQALTGPWPCDCVLVEAITAGTSKVYQAMPGKRPKRAHESIMLDTVGVQAVIQESLLLGKYACSIYRHTKHISHICIYV